MFKLKKTIYRECELKGYLSIWDIHEIAKWCGQRQSTAERRARELSERSFKNPNPKIEADHVDGNPNKPVRGYRWVDTSVKADVFVQRQINLL